MNIVEKVNLKDLIESKLTHLDLYSYYMPHSFELNKNCSNPFVTKDKNPSFRVFYKEGSYFHKAYNSSHKGTIYDFLKDLYNISYKEVLDKIAEDFGLKEKTGKKYEKIITELPKIEIRESILPNIKAISKNFQKEHIDYLAQFALTLDSLNSVKDTEILALSKFWINNNLYSLDKEEVGFIYYCTDINKVKIYLPQRDKGKRFYSCLPFTYIHGKESFKCVNDQKHKKGILTKSIKDALVLSKYIQYPIGVVQAENPTSITQEDIEFFNENVEEMFISWDSDGPGVKNCKELTSKLGWNYINPPKRYLPNIKDWADLQKEIGEKALLNEFKKKKLIL
jgi:hypothetical protein